MIGSAPPTGVGAASARSGTGLARQHGHQTDGRPDTLAAFHGGLSSIGVVTDLGRRNQGFGGAMVSTLTTDALLESPLAQFRMLEENGPALRIARVLGFIQDGRTLEVVLRPAAEPVSD